MRKRCLSIIVISMATLLLTSAAFAGDRDCRREEPKVVNVNVDKSTTVVASPAKKMNTPQVVSIDNIIKTHVKRKFFIVGSGNN